MDDKSAYIAKNLSDGVANALKIGDAHFFTIVIDKDNFHN